MAIAPESTQKDAGLGLRERGCAHLSRLERSWHGRVTTHLSRPRRQTRTVKLVDCQYVMEVLGDLPLSVA